MLQPFALYAETLDLAQEQPKVSQPATESAPNVSTNTSGDQVESDSAAQDSSTPDSSEATDAEATSDEESNTGADEASDEASDDDIEAPLAENSWRYVDGSLRSDLPDDYGANADFEGRAMHSMPKGATAQGIDVSEHNGTINWQSVKDAGIDFAILRVGFAGDTSGGRLDNYFKRNVSECERLGIPYGVYLYSYARNEDEAQAESRLMLSALKGHSPTLPVYYDLEEQKTNADGSPKWTPFNDPSKLASIAKTFCGQIAAAGYKPGIYANVNWFKNYLTDPCFLSSGWSIWTAQYWYGGRYDECLGLTPDAPAKYDCWQYSARGSVPGVSGDVDVSYWFGEGLGDHWQETDEGKYYVSSNGQPYKGWKLISGVWYWFDPAKGGAMATGLHECNGSMYYFHSSGAMATGWVLDGGSWYYAGGSGVLASGWLRLGGAWYWL
ncbi:MAG: GH25 family lysozyme, partial [Collinsella sp.]|nr:GH25 family lysozyme [Collinsella sp.]